MKHTDLTIRSESDLGLFNAGYNVLPKIGPFSEVVLSKILYELLIHSEEISFDQLAYVLTEITIWNSPSGSDIYDHFLRLSNDPNLPVKIVEASNGETLYIMDTALLETLLDYSVLLLDADYQNRISSKLNTLEEENKLLIDFDAVINHGVEKY